MYRIKESGYVVETVNSLKELNRALELWRDAFPNRLFSVEVEE